MKTALMFVAATMASCVFAADITTSDGRTYRDASVISQTPRNVTIKHSGGLTSVSKQLLPESLRAAFPIDENAAKAAEKKAAAAREAARKARNAENERLAQLQAERETIAASDQVKAEEAAAEEAARSAEYAKKAKVALERHFRKTLSSSNGPDRVVDVTITEIRQPSGWDDRLTVKGQVVVRASLQNSGSSDNGVNSRTSAQADYFASQKNSDARSFDADYAPSSDSVTSVTLR
jgi:hypothetical protein